MPTSKKPQRTQNVKQLWQGEKELRRKRRQRQRQRALKTKNQLTFKQGEGRCLSIAMPKQKSKRSEQQNRRQTTTVTSSSSSCYLPPPSCRVGELQLAQALENSVEPTQNAPQRRRQHNASPRFVSPPPPLCHVYLCECEDEDDQVQVE